MIVFGSANERPFDFADALLEGGEAPFFWLTMSDYLERLRTAAINDRDNRLAGEEREIFSSGLNKQEDEFAS